jgi:hypothetical protein
MSIITDIDEHYSILHFDDTRECYDLVCGQAQVYMELYGGNERNLENYQFDSDVEYYLGPMLRDNKFLGYTIIYQDCRPMAFGGIRSYDSQTTIIAARAFCFPTPKLLISKIMIPYHLQCSKSLGYTKSITTFNQHNYKIYKNWPIINLKKSPVIGHAFEVDVGKFNLLGLDIVNNVEQWVIGWDL